MSTMTSWGEDYAALSLRVDKHFEGFVDAYCGPENLKAEIDKEEPRPLDELFDEAVRLADTVPAEDRARKVFLEKQVRGIKTTIQVLQGEEIDYVTQVELFFDFKPEKVPDSKFEKEKEVLQDIFRGQDLITALAQWRKKRELPEDLIQKTITALSDECRKRTRRLIPLPDGEQIDFVLVTDKPWSGYNWFLGTYRSRVEINTDIPIQSVGLPTLVSHEAYPGHHTEHAVKEQVLYKEKGFTEASISVYNTPECIISEGIANAGFNLIFKTYEEVYQFLNETMGLGIDVEADAAISEALHQFYSISGNASLMIHKENAEPSEAIQYLMDVGLTPRERAEKQIQFITNPLFRTYVFNYSVGEEIVSTAYKEINPKIFYENQICPSNIDYFRK